MLYGYKNLIIRMVDTLDDIMKKHMGNVRRKIRSNFLNLGVSMFD